VPKILASDVNVSHYSYSPQYAGLEHATIRDNIIFGSKLGFNEERYHAVIEACALERDLDVFEAGDMTGVYSPLYSLLRRD
jgi:hypothetical protein